ncbi:MAG: hypothetical protein QNJ69_07260 [Gammaproteobacteria bacterium]|nr:hypothetical protein [Gammaproteobacteria bacterium]
MQDQTIRDVKKTSGHKHKTLEWLLYLPGAVIMCYGLWLSVTAA